MLGFYTSQNSIKNQYYSNSFDHVSMYLSNTIYENIIWNPHTNTTS